MPRASRGRPRRPARLVLRTRPGGAIWYIHDDGRHISTGCREGETGAAESALAAHVAGRRDVRQGARDPDRILIADVVAAYADDVATRHARPHETAARLARIIDHFGEMTLDAVTGRECRAYADARSTPSAARRELQDLQAAINHYRREGLCHAVVSVWMPPREERRVRWLTRDEAARLIRAAWRRREVQRGRETERRPWRHIARFILVALYTGSRSGVVCAASFEPVPGRGLVDLEHGIFYRRPDRYTESRKRATPQPIDPRLLAHMRRWRRLGQRFVVEYAGRPVAAIKRHFPEVAAAAGLGRDVTAHVLRHTAATWAMRNGADMWSAAGFLGMSPETLRSVYGHHHPAAMTAAAAAIAARPGAATKWIRKDSDEAERTVTERAETPMKTTTA